MSTKSKSLTDFINKPVVLEELQKNLSNNKIQSITSPVKSKSIIKNLFFKNSKENSKNSKNSSDVSIYNNLSSSKIGSFFKKFQKNNENTPKEKNKNDQQQSVVLSMPVQREKERDTNILNYQCMEILCNETRTFNETLTNTMFKQDQYIFSLFIMFIIIGFICLVFLIVIIFLSKKMISIDGHLQEIFKNVNETSIMIRQMKKT